MTEAAGECAAQQPSITRGRTERTTGNGDQPLGAGRGLFPLWAAVEPQGRSSTMTYGDGRTSATHALGGKVGS